MALFDVMECIGDVPLKFPASPFPGEGGGPDVPGGGCSADSETGARQAGPPSGPLHAGNTQTGDEGEN